MYSHNTSIKVTIKPKSTNHAIQHALKIVENKYKKADLPSVVSNCPETPSTLYWMTGPTEPIYCGKLVGEGIDHY